jgi:hypothetical protein
MRFIALFMTLFSAALFASAQGGSGAPSPVGQTISAQAASAAERSVEARHDRAVVRSKAKAARRAAHAASAGGN